MSSLLGCTAPLTVDRYDDEPSASACVEGVPNDCSLRGAVLNANRTPGADTVRLPPGELVLTVPGRDEDDGETGDLDIHDDLEITGPLSAQGEPGVYLSALWLDRLLHIRGEESQPVVRLSGLVLWQGAPSADASTPSADGGALLVDGGQVTLERCWLSGSYARRGGAVSNHGSLTVAESQLGGNQARDAGGGIENAAGGELRLDRTTIAENTVDSLEDAEGGGIWNGGALYVVSSTLRDNVARGGTFARGGAVLNQGALAVANSTFTGNVTLAGLDPLGGEGGGIYNTGTATLVHATFSENLVAAIWNAAGTIEIANSLVADFTLVPFAAPSCVGDRMVSSGGNLEVRGDSCGFDQPSDQVGVTAPVVGALADNGGPTHTQALLAGSPAVNAGLGLACLATDQRGAPRDDGHCDIGAYERQPEDF